MSRSISSTIRGITGVLSMLVVIGFHAAAGSAEPTPTGLFDEAILARNTDAVRSRAATQSPNERLNYLTNWVLPSATHATIRLNCTFTQTDSAPVAVDPGPNGLRPDGPLVSPVFDLLDLAKDLNKLQELRTRIQSVDAGADQYARRAKLALLLLVDRELGDRQGLLQAADQLFALVQNSTPVDVDDMWPETVVVYRCLWNSDSEPIINELLSIMFEQRTEQNSIAGHFNWHSLMASLMGRRRLGRFVDVPRTSTEQLDDWIPAVRSLARTRGNGHSSAEWFWDGHSGHHVSGHDFDFLYYRTPLQGNFAIEGSMAAWGMTQFLANGSFHASRWNPAQIETGTFRKGAEVSEIDPPFSHFDPEVRFRIVCQDGKCTKYINGREIVTEEVTEHSDPWVAVRCWHQHAGFFRDIRISGNPVIPDTVPMATSADLVGWLPYFEETIGYYTARWHYLEPPMEEGQLIGRSDPAAEGTHCESLLRYHRPLSRNGAVEYEFFYDPGHVHTHPALDRLAFILDPDGVRVHWITDAEFDRTSVAPDNVFDEPENRRGSAWLPLRSKAWNHVRLQVEDQLVSLELNGQQVYERELETTNQRTFGLFHYVDQTEVRVRNLEMQGDWPTALPAPSEQQAAEQLTVWLDATRADFKSEFSHDFTTQGLPEDHFKVAADNGGLAVARPDGVHVQRPGLGRWSAVDIRLPFTVEGDFDIEASFEQFQGESDKDACIMLLALLNDQLQSQCRSMRIRTQAKRQQLHVSLSQMRADGNRSFGTTVQDSCEATAGRLRLSRRDKTVYWMFAENDSDVFQPIGSEIVSDAPVSPDGMQLRVLCNGTGGTSVVWKKVVLQAERLAWFPPNAAPEPRRLQVMNSDGSNLQVVMEVPEGFTQFGSPEWSADGKRIAFDASNGSTTTSHVMVVDADGNNLQDLGLGCMPGFSADGKRMVFSQPGQGVVMMDADGSNRQTIDQSGWGVQWSPDGKHIAYGNAGNITIMNLDTKEKRPLLVGEQASRYSYIYWNLAWSRDSRSVCAKARLRQTGAYEVMVADIDSPAGFQVLHSTSGSINADFTWDPDNRHVLFAMHNPAFKGPQLYLVSRDNPGRPELFPGQPTDRKIYDCAWSPDGQFIVFSGQQFPQPIEWTGNDTRAATDTNPLFRQLIFDIDN